MLVQEIRRIMGRAQVLQRKALSTTAMRVHNPCNPRRAQIRTQAMHLEVLQLYKEPLIASYA
jgi:hypothetical protein